LEKGTALCIKRGLSGNIFSVKVDEGKNNYLWQKEKGKEAKERYS
jgi:hypothetical protein